MRAVIQRVKGCHVDIAGQTVGSINNGVLVLLGVEAADTTEDIEWLACLLYTSPSPRDRTRSRMPSSA